MWRELQLLGLPRGLIEPVSARLFALGTSGVQEDYLPGQAPPPRQPWDTGAPPPAPRRVLLRAWFEDPDEAALLTSLADIDAEMAWSDVPETDWEQAFRDRFPPVHITSDLVLAPPWNAPPGALVIEPGQGFGTTRDNPEEQFFLRTPVMMHQRNLHVGLRGNQAKGCAFESSFGKYLFGRIQNGGAARAF